MKTQIISIAVLLISIIAKGQITELTTQKATSAGVIKVGEEYKNYILQENEAIEILLYNSDFSVEETVTVDTSFIDAKYVNRTWVSVIMATTHTFDLDEGIEFLIEITYVDKDENWSDKYDHLLVIDSDGSLLYEFPNEFYLNYIGDDYGAFYNTNNQSVLILSHNDTVKFFTLPGRVDSEISTGQKEYIIDNPKTKSGISLEQSYPNPTNGKVNIVYDLPEGTTGAKLFLFALNGRMVNVTTLDTDESMVQINTSTCPSGTYFYQIKADNGYSEAKKLLVIK